MYVCMHVRVCARARAGAVCVCVRCVAGCEGVRAAHVLARVLGVECIWFALGHGACVLCGVCVCTLVGSTFLPD